MASISTARPTGFVALPLGPFLFAISDVTRWRILAELSTGEPRMVVELARQFQIPTSTVSKHIGVLRRAGLVQVGRGRLYAVPAPYRPVPGERVLDYGHAVLRFAEEAAAG